MSELKNNEIELSAAETNEEETFEVELTMEERMENVEKNLSFFKEVIEANTRSYQELIQALGKLMETNQRNDSELSRWMDTVEERLGRIMVENVNLGLIVGEAITLTPEQRRNIDRKVLEIKKKHKESLEKEKKPAQ